MGFLVRFFNPDFTALKKTQLIIKTFVKKNRSTKIAERLKNIIINYFLIISLDE